MRLHTLIATLMLLVLVPAQAKEVKSLFDFDSNMFTSKKRAGVGKPKKTSTPTKKGGSTKGQKCGSSAICPAFNKVFAACAPGCVPGTMYAAGKRGGKSCHNVGAAVDLMFYTCNGKNVMPLSATFDKFVKCVAGKVKKVLYKQKVTSKRKDWRTHFHYDHVHISNGCKQGGKGYW